MLRKAMLSMEKIQKQKWRRTQMPTVKNLCYMKSREYHTVN